MGLRVARRLKLLVLRLVNDRKLRLLGEVDASINDSYGVELRGALHAHKSGPVASVLVD